MARQSLTASFAGLARSKITIPRPNARYVERPRLLDKLDQLVFSNKVTLIQAPAGYGKSSLLSSWALTKIANAKDSALPHPKISWLNCDISDEDPFLFLINIIHSLSNRGIEIDEHVLKLTQNRKFTTPEILAIELANNIYSANHDIVLCIDDLHLISNSPSMEILATLIENTPSDFHFIIASREAIKFATGRLQTYGKATELGVEDLRFDNDEMLEFFSCSGPPDLNTKELNIIGTNTEGWAAGLRLASVVLSGQEDRDELLSSLTGGRKQLSDFFGEEILAMQSLQLQEFLIKTSILDKFCPELCEHITKIGLASNLIKECEEKGLFLIPLDHTRTWFRYHHLFAQFVQKKLHERSNKEIQELHLLACDWFEEAGMTFEAFNHALYADKPFRAGEILEAKCDEIFAAGQQLTMMELIARLPIHVRNQFPQVLLSAAWRLIALWKLDQAEDVLAICRKRLDELHQDSNVDKKLLETCEYYMLHRKMILASFRNQMGEVEEIANTLLDNFKEAHPYLKNNLYNQLLEAERLQFKLRNIDRHITLAREQALLAESEHAMVFNAGLGSTSLYCAGRIEESIKMLEEGVELAKKLTGHTIALVSVAAMPLAHTYYELNQIDKASELIDKYLESATTLGVIEQLLTGWTTQSKLKALEGAKDQAIEILRKGIHFAMAHGFNRLQTALEAEYVRQTLRLGRLDEAVAFTKTMDMPSSEEGHIPRKNPDVRDSENAMTWVRISLAQGRISEAIKVIRHWRRLLAPTLVVPMLLRWDMFYTHALVLEGNTTEALRVLDKTLARAAKLGLVRMFTDEGPAIAGLVEHLCKKTPNPNADIQNFAQNILNLFIEEHGYKPTKIVEEDEDSGLQGSLSRRELQVLNLAASRMSNREIGDILGLTEGSVKWYLQQIYDKIGVRRRSEASVKARRLGLIS